MVTNERALTSNQTLTRKSFSELQVGDRVRVLAKIANIKTDKRNDPPHWYLLSLFDGTATIRMFVNDIQTLEVGNTIEIEFSVKDGKPYQGRPQLAFDIWFLSRSDEVLEFKEPSPKPCANGDRKAFLRKDELNQFPDGQPVKIFTKVLSLLPKDGIREKNQKLLVADLENRPVSLWIPKTEFGAFEAMKDQYFLLHAKLKKFSEKAAFMSFESLTNDQEATKDDAARAFYMERVDYYTRELLKCLTVLQAAGKEDKGDGSMLMSMLETFRKSPYLKK